MKLLTLRYYGQVALILDAYVRFNAHGAAVGIERFAGHMPLRKPAPEGAPADRSGLDIDFAPLEERHYRAALRFPALYGVVAENDGEKSQLQEWKESLVTAESGAGGRVLSTQDAPVAQNAGPTQRAFDTQNTNETQPGLESSGLLDSDGKDAPPNPNALTIAQSLESGAPVEVPDSKAVVDAVDADVAHEVVAHAPDIPDSPIEAEILAAEEVSPKRRRAAEPIPVFCD